MLSTASLAILYSPISWTHLADMGRSLDLHNDIYAYICIYIPCKKNIFKKRDQREKTD